MAAGIIVYVVRSVVGVGWHVASRPAWMASCLDQHVNPL
jgi:hypothetical protein